MAEARFTAPQPGAAQGQGAGRGSPQPPHAAARGAFAAPQPGASHVQGAGRAAPQPPHASPHFGGFTVEHNAHAQGAGGAGFAAPQARHAARADAGFSSPQGWGAGRGAPQPPHAPSVGPFPAPQPGKLHIQGPGGRAGTAVHVQGVGFSAPHAQQLTALAPFSPPHALQNQGGTTPPAP
jgi:hypothetical protein